jgi:hypothetical protein
MLLAIIVGMCCLIIGLALGFALEWRPSPNAEARRALGKSARKRAQTKLLHVPLTRSSRILEMLV